MVEYSGIPLTPKLIEKLLPDVLTSLPQDGSTFSRADFINALRQISQADSIVIDDSKITFQAKKALKKAVDMGLLKRPFDGAQSYVVCDASSVALDEPGDDRPTVKQQEDGLVGSKKLDGLEVEEVMGEGQQCVYCYYLPAYRRLAENDGEDGYSIKIGFTKDLNPDARILGQATTALPEKPVIALLIKTHDAAALEKVIHAALDFKGQKIHEARGEEWYSTNVDKIKEIIHPLIG